MSLIASPRAIWIEHIKPPALFVSSIAAPRYGTWRCISLHADNDPLAVPAPSTAGTAAVNPTVDVPAFNPRARDGEVIGTDIGRCAFGPPT
ncbi:hypothetical protein CGRA01v4_01122 [Colletotrichum graminicola]|nr:hypothetical protein CGRA01v4_01122 [Colletotrichum graminicola]